MGFYATEPAFLRGVGNGKRAVGFFSADHRRNAPSRSAKSLAKQGLSAVVSRTSAPGVPLYGYRYLSTELGRWVNRDPIGENGFQLLQDITQIQGTVQSDGIFNLEDPDFSRIDAFGLYLFVKNTPSNEIDVLGLWGQMGFQKCKAPEIWKQRPNGTIPAVDGCSAPWWLPGSPNNPGWFLDCDMTPACNNHDNCYSDCNSTRSQCDDRLRDDMYTQCTRCASRFPNTSWGRERRIYFQRRCRRWADTYRRGVRFGGRDPYRNRQTQNCHCACP